ncbi:unnamed protein product [Cylicocyclus nassatus]|uniref:Uncharacterized protein n=1 Tax=Cylicocyclus nassatus TaxID=53992 RepID=A0AA36GQB4_CYLNA|nr:unnamed protein product [Cylicocyclus nassatus]
MINVFNSPIEASSIDEFSEGRSDEKQVFEKRRRRPKITYTADGRKLIDGKIDQEQTPNALWTTTISRGVANDWRAKAEGGPFYKAKRYVAAVSQDVKVFVKHSVHHYGTAILVLLNLFLAYTICRLFKIL